MDKFRIIYKILRTLEQNMGKEDFDYEKISAQAMKTTYEIWEQLLIMMYDEGYIKGIVLATSTEDKFPHIAEPIRPVITIKGLEYLADNSFMAKAKETLKMIGEIV